MTFHSSDELAAQFTGLIKSWLKKMVRRGLASSIDEEQLASTILFDLIRCVGKLDGESLEHGVLVRICRTITNRKVSNAVIFAQRRNHVLATQNDPRFDLNEFPDWDKQLLPEQQVELDDFIMVLESSLDAKNREIVELKRMGWTNEEIALKLEVSIRTIQSRYETIEMACDVLQKKSDHPSPISHLPSPISHLPKNRRTFDYAEGILNFFFDFASRLCPIC